MIYSKDTILDVEIQEKVYIIHTTGGSYVILRSKTTWVPLKGQKILVELLGSNIVSVSRVEYES